MGFGGGREVSGGKYKGDTYIRYTGVDLKIAPDSPHLVVGKQFPYVGSQEDVNSDVLSRHAAALAHTAGKERQKQCLPPCTIPPYCLLWFIPLSV
jgi:hypothetical protein